MQSKEVKTDEQRPAQCKECGALFLPIAKTDYLDHETRLTFYECPACHHKTTIWISNNYLRRLMAIQKAKKGPKDPKLQQEILRLMNDLRKRWQV